MCGKLYIGYTLFALAKAPLFLLSFTIANYLMLDVNLINNFKNLI